MPELHVNGRRIADDEPAYVIAEIGHNHQGELEKAKALDARGAGVRRGRRQAPEARQPAPLHARVLRLAVRQREQLRRDIRRASRGARAREERLVRASRYAREEGVAFVAAAFDEPSAEFLAELGVDAFKFASGDLLNVPFLRLVAGYGRPLFLSTGGGTMEDIDRAVEAIASVNQQLCVLHCTASYPAEIEDLNLTVIAALRERYPDFVVGLSDHHNGIAMAPVAYMLGARAFEKHFTLNHAWKGTDHAYSLMPDGMRRFVRDLHRVPAALGDGVKRRLPSEERPLEKMGKKLVAARDLPSGHVLVPGDLEARSPADGGLPPYELDRLLGGTLLRALSAQEDVALEDVSLVAQPVAARNP